MFVQYVCTVTVHTLIAYTNIWEYFSMGHILKKKAKKFIFVTKVVSSRMSSFGV